MLQSLKPLYSKLLSPVARGLIKSGIHPNAITLTGLCISPVAGLMAAQGHWLLSALFIGLGALTDGLDGLVARQTGKKSSWGAILDSTADRLTEIFWLGGLAYYFMSAPNGRIGVIFSFAAMSGSLMVSYVRARSEGERIPCVSGIAQRPERIIALIVCLTAGPLVMAWGLFALAVISYLTVLQRLMETFRYSKKQDDAARSAR